MPIKINLESKKGGRERDYANVGVIFINEEPITAIA